MTMLQKLRASAREHWVPSLELALREVFQVMLDAKLGRANQASSGEMQFTAMVGLAGSLCGVFTFRCTADSAARIAGKMLRTEGTVPDEQIVDAVGEVCNMIAGNFKNKILGLGESCLFSAPTVVVGAEYKVHALAGPAIATSLCFEGNPVTVAVELRF